MNAPAWLLLLWCGLAAATVAAIPAAIVGGTSTAAWSLAPVPRSRAHGAMATILLGVLLYPLLYGLLFELLHRADYKLGLVIGLGHAAIMFIVARRDSETRNAIRVGLAHAAYGLVLGFLYVTP